MGKKRKIDEADWYDPGESRKSAKRVARRVGGPESHKGPKTPPRPTFCEFEVATEDSLRAKGRDELVAEVIRLQTLQRGVAVELGICQSSKSGEYGISPCYVSNIITLVRASESFNL